MFSTHNLHMSRLDRYQLLSLARHLAISFRTVQTISWRRLVRPCIPEDTQHFWTWIFQSKYPNSQIDSQTIAITNHKQNIQPHQCQKLWIKIFNLVSLVFLNDPAKLVSCVLTVHGCLWDATYDYLIITPCTHHYLPLAGHFLSGIMDQAGKTPTQYYQWQNKKNLRPEHQ